MVYNVRMQEKFYPHLEKIEKSIHSFLPTSATSEWICASFGDIKIEDNLLKPLIEPTRALVDLGGKRWRPLLLVLCARAASKNKEDSQNLAYKIAPLVEFVHTASLIHDDIEDKSDFRRGKPATHITFGVDTALNAGSWLYFEAAVCIDKLSCSEEQKNLLYSTFLSELRLLHLGQAIDISWHRDNSLFPSPEEYLLMAHLKTGTLASLAAKIGVLIAKEDEKIAEKAGKIAADIGAGFQVIDDVINLTSGNPGKKRGDDIVEGKKSLPVLLFAKKYKDEPCKIEKLKDCFSKAFSEGIESQSIEDAILLLQDSGAIEDAHKKGANLIDEGRKAFIDLFGPNNEDALLIQELFTSMIPKEKADGGKNA